MAPIAAAAAPLCPAGPPAPAVRSPRGFSLSALRLAVLGAAAALLARLPLSSLPTLCPVRALTGVPCPLCGSTTAATSIGRLDLLGALGANPVTVAAAAAVVLAPVAVARGARLPRLRPRLLAGLLAASWLWQLARFGLLDH